MRMPRIALVATVLALAACQDPSPTTAPPAKQDKPVRKAAGIAEPKLPG